MGEYGARSVLQVPGRIIFGTNTLNELGQVVESYGKRAVLVFGGSSLVKSGIYERIVTLLKDHGIQLHDIGGIGHDPDEEQVRATVRQVLDIDPDVILGAGGGSVIDVAKAASLIATNGGEVADYWKGRAFTEPSIPCVAVPTTSGTGAEITKNAVISSADRSFKKSIRSDLMIPDVALVDPALTLSVPPEVTAHTGLDALIQNLEAYTSRGAGPITDTLARKGIELAGADLVRAVKVPEDIDAREAMSLASLYGGITLANAGLGLAHGLAHPLGIRYGIPHGMACALTMAKVIQHNRPARRQRYEEIAGLLGGGADAADAFGSLLECLGVPARLSDYGVKKSDIPRIVEESRGGSRGYNPIDHNDETVARMLEELL